MARIQRLECKHLYVGTERSLYPKRFYVNWWVNNILHYRDKDDNGAPLTAQSAVNWAKEGAKHNVFMFCSGPVPVNNNQHGVFFYADVGIGKTIVTNFKFDHDKVMNAYKSVMGVQTIGGPVQVQVAVPAEVPRIVLGVQFSPNGSVYSFYTSNTHYIGDFVGVHNKDGDVNVKVISVAVMTAADVKKLLTQINNRIKEKGGIPIKDLVSIKSNTPFTDVSAWTKWGKEDIPEKYRQTGDTDGDIPEYASEEAYCENIEELEAMRECFQPTADIVYCGDLPDPEPDEVWSNAEVSDLPE